MAGARADDARTGPAVDDVTGAEDQHARLQGHAEDL
jgi:hypothetical protein